MTFAVRAVEDAEVNPGLLGFVVVALLGLATWLLLRSMTRHLGKVEVPRDDELPADVDRSAGDGSAADRSAADHEPDDEPGAAHDRSRRPEDPQP